MYSILMNTFIMPSAEVSYNAVIVIPSQPLTQCNFLSFPFLNLNLNHVHLHFQNMYCAKPYVPYIPNNKQINLCRSGSAVLHPTIIMTWLPALLTCTISCLVVNFFSAFKKNSVSAQSLAGGTDHRFTKAEKPSSQAPHVPDTPQIVYPRGGINVCLHHVSPAKSSPRLLNLRLSSL